MLSSFVDAHQRPSERGIKPAFRFSFVCIFQGKKQTRGGTGREGEDMDRHTTRTLYDSVYAVEAEAYPRCAIKCAGFSVTL